jgi:hypothetical protein
MSYQPQDPRAKLGRQLLRDLGETEAADRRAGPRFLAPPLHIVVKDKTYTTVDWGIGALVIGDYHDVIAIGRKLVVTLSVASQPTVAHRALMQVLRYEPRRGHLILQFVEVDKGLLGWLGDLQLTGEARTV